jgi:hypothetical protein
MTDAIFWKPIDENTPKDRPILGWCVHDADPYFIDEGKYLTAYGLHCEGIGHVEDGPHVLVWGGECEDYDEWRDRHYTIPAWWFRFGSEFEEVANPVLWAEVPIPEHGTVKRYTYSINWMGPIDPAWITKNGHQWSAGRIDVYHPDLIHPQEIALPAMLDKDFFALGKWLTEQESITPYTLETILERFEKIHGKVVWFK